MSVNRDRPHLYILPEDEADNELANGFFLRFASSGQTQIMPYSRGWMPVIEYFENEFVGRLRQKPEGHVVLLIDFDNDTTRRSYIRRRIPEDIAGRAFVLGVLSNPERLKAALNRKPLEKIGQSLAKDCHGGTTDFWDHALLRDNIAELGRLRAAMPHDFFLWNF